jgi:hypothetical protein
MDETLKVIADFILSYRVVSPVNPEEPYVQGWNDGVAMAAEQLLDDDVNKVVRKQLIEDNWDGMPVDINKLKGKDKS